MGDYIKLQDLEVYKKARELSKFAWGIYSAFSWQDKKIIGDQFITATDSVGANIAEGYSRYHYLDKVKFYYISRASLSECCDHWLELLYERGKITEDKFKEGKNLQYVIGIKLNNFIRANCQSKQRE
ncbi:MAG: four helix bundle protein [Patescibacteria group bacterium]